MGSFIKRVVSQVILALLLSGFSSCAHELNVKNFGGSEESTDNTTAFQKCLAESAVKKCDCYVPKGTYYFSQDLFLPSGSSLIGEGEASRLIFNKGGVRGYKNGSANFYYTNNYNNEVVPDAKYTQLRRKVNQGVDHIEVANSDLFKVGDNIVMFNNKLDSWVILEDEKQSTKWNGAHGDYFAKGGSFKVKNIQGDTLFLDTKLPFALPEHSMISLRSGISNVKIKKLAIVRKTDGYAILLEQPLSVSMNQLMIKGYGGILLSHYANKCSITDNIIDSERGYAVCIENFSSDNAVLRNNVVFRRSGLDTGGDCAIILLMGAYNNQVCYNDVKNIGERSRDFGGIFSHALSFNNRITNNNINGAAEGIGTYYGAFNNIFTENVIEKVRIGIVSYYSRSNVYTGNRLNISYIGKEYSYGILDYGTLSNTYQTSKLSGEMTIDIKNQGSKGMVVKR